MNHFYFVLTNPEAEPLLKMEIQAFYPELTLSYSRPGFITFKANKKVGVSPLMARLAGDCLGRFKKDELNYPKAWVWKRDDSLTIPEDLQKLSDSSLFKVGEKVTLIMMIGNDEYWVGEYLLKKTHLQTPGEVSSILQQKVPSRAYYKLAEAYEAFDLPFDHQEIVLELGSAPGGASKFLLEQDMRVIGVDPAEMDPDIKKNINFKHIARPFETLTEKDFKSDVDWIISDINLPPTVIMKEVERLLNFLNPRGVVLTMKLNQEKHLHFLRDYVATLRKKGFERVELKYLPSHRQEICLMALHS